MKLLETAINSPPLPDLEKHCIPEMRLRRKQGMTHTEEQGSTLCYSSPQRLALAPPEGMVAAYGHHWYHFYVKPSLI